MIVDGYQCVSQAISPPSDFQKQISAAVSCLDKWVNEMSTVKSDWEIVICWCVRLIHKSAPSWGHVEIEHALNGFDTL